MESEAGRFLHLRLVASVASGILSSERCLNGGGAPILSLRRRLKPRHLDSVCSLVVPIEFGALSSEKRLDSRRLDSACNLVVPTARVWSVVD